MDQELKQRLIGASVIIALAIIFVPMLFDGAVEQKNNQNISINIPEVGENNLEVKKFELDKPVSETNDMPPSEAELVVNNEQVQLIEKDAANAPTLPITETTVPSTEAIEVEAAKPQAEITSLSDEKVETQVEPVIPVAEVEPKEVVEPVIETVKPESLTDLKQVYRVKLGSFSQQGNAEKVKSALLQKQIKTIVEYNPGLKLYRVWSQELYQDESNAQNYVTAVDKLKLNIGVPKVVTLNASEVSQMASQGQMGWVVQLGSFSAKKNAIELRNKVKAAGFSGFVDVITNSKGVMLYRLRIGPLMEKIDAEKTKGDIKQKLKLDGLIKNHELGTIVD